MTSANVSGVMQMQDLITRVNKLSDEIGTGVDFSAMVQQSVSNDSLKTETAVNDLKPAESDDQANTSFEKQKNDSQALKSQVRSEEKRTVSDDMKKKLRQDASEAESEIKEKVSQVLGVDEEEVAKAMEILGLTVADLAEPKNLGLLVAELTGNDDPAALLISEDFTNLVSDVKEIFADFAASNDMSVAEFVDVLSQMEQTDISADDMAQVSEMIPQKAETITRDAAPAAEDNQIEEKKATTDENGETVLSVKTGDGEVKKTVINTAEDSDEDSTKDEAKSSQQTGTSQTPVKTTGETTFADTAQTVNHADAQENQNQVAEAPAQESTPQPVYDPQQIISDIVTEAKVAYSPDNDTQIQMVLNPEELGKLLLSVNSSKEGNITARFTVETEIAKEVLEQQMVMLRDNLNTQGVKVDAVEVTVSSHAFEENLEGEFQREQHEGEKAEENVNNRRRNINLDDLSELGGLMSEEEMLVASIMRDNGNTVNFTA